MSSASLAAVAQRISTVAPADRPGRVTTDRAADPVVIKFGSSVLGSEQDIPAAVSEIYRHVRDGRRVIAVVSAFRGQTDRLLAQARRLGVDHDNLHLPGYVALGEESAASLMAIGCDRAGLDCAVLTARELGLVGHGPAENAWPVGLDARRLKAALEAHDVVVVPGFAAVSAAGHVVLLGRGGSDLTAVFIAAELGLDAVRLIKDVDGVYAGDPALCGAPLRFGSLGWETARRMAGRLIQDRALDLAQARGLVIEVAAPGRAAASRIGAGADLAAPVAPPVRRRVAVAGCGVVGGGVIRRLLEMPDAFEVVGVLVRDAARPRDPGIPAGLFSDDAAGLLSTSPDLLVEALSEGEAGARLIRAALEAGIDVVTANKQALSGDLEAMVQLAGDQGASLLYSAAVGGGAPIIETVRRARAAGEVVSLQAVLNGTVNFLIDCMAQGLDFDTAMAQARAAGFAEEDPSSDLEGRDAVAKLRILAYEAFGAILADDLPCEHLDGASTRNRTAWAALRQVARCTRTPRGLVAGVALEPILETSPFHHLRGERNAVEVVIADGRRFIGRGRGAGRWPTAESVFADIMSLRRASECM